MFRRLRHVLTLSLVLSLTLTSPGFSNTEGVSEGGTSGGSGGAVGLSNAVTKSVVKSIKRGVARCQRVEKIYRFDCYRQTYKYASTLLFGRPSYAGALEALTSVEQALDQIMAREVDPHKPPVRQGFQQYRAIKPAAVPKATAALDRALSGAETLLLRSPERTGTHYARIAEALDSNKVLLRSRLYPQSDDLLRTAFA
jgi:hypothetical protein